MFRYIETEEDAKNLYEIFKSVLDEYKGQNMSDKELFHITETRYYMTYVFDKEVNSQIVEEYDDYDYNDNGYDGYDGYDN
jgi:hypothetical protein